MQNDDKPATASAVNNSLSDDEIIQFAETVLADLEEGTIAGDEEQALVDDDDEIIDLTEVAEKPQQSDDLLDLTEDMDLGPSVVEDIPDGENMAEEAEIMDDAVFEAEEDIEELTMEDDAVLDADEDAAEMDLLEEDAAELELFAESFDTADETEISDLFAENEEKAPIAFEAETAAENLTHGAEETSATMEIGEEDALTASEEPDFDAPVAGDEPPAVAAEAPSTEYETTAAQQEKLELSEADRVLLEEELSLGGGDVASTESIDRHDTTATPAGPPLDGTLDSGDLYSAENDELAGPTAGEGGPTGLAEEPGDRRAETFDFDEIPDRDVAAQSQPSLTLPDAEKAATAALMATSGAAAQPLTDRDDSPAPSTQIPEAFSGARLEAAVEQAVQKIVAEKIDTMVAEALDKAVAKEIERLKTLILGNLDPDR